MPTSHSPTEIGLSHAPEQSDLYRSLSAAAVLALLLGLSSAVAFVSPLLLVVPLAAVLVALLALTKTTGPSSEFSGAPLAKWGLALAVGFAVASVARSELRDSLYRNQAESVARAWVEACAAGDSSTALALIAPQARMGLKPKGVTDDIALTFDETMIAAIFSQESVVEALRQLGQAGNLKVAILRSSIDPHGVMPEAGFEFSVSVGAGDSRSVSLVLERVPLAGSGHRWLVATWR
jgi:hypothetical protein